MNKETDKEDENKDETSDEEEENTTAKTSVKDIGVATDKNSRFRRTMEDAHVVVDGFGGVSTQGYFAVYDGHGGRGAVDFTAKALHENLLVQLEKYAEDPVEALKQAYLRTDVQIGEAQVGAGTTAVSALIRYKGNERWLYIANAGDARGVLGRNGKAIRLSYDHKGTDEGESKRIVDLGGFILLNRVNGILAVTRSLGDTAMKEFVTGEPYITATKLNETDSHLILACDGLWDVTTDQEALDLISDESSAQKMSEKLLLHALKKGSTDNISVMVILL